MIVPSFHTKAAMIYRSARTHAQKIVTTNYVLTELVALLTSPLGIARPTIIGLVNGLRTSPYIDIVHVDPVLDAAGWSLLQARPDKDWSLVDCTSTSGVNVSSSASSLRGAAKKKRFCAV